MTNTFDVINYEPGSFMIKLGSLIMTNTFDVDLLMNQVHLLNQLSFNSKEAKDKY